jgi:hypothetical protein
LFLNLERWKNFGNAKNKLGGRIGLTRITQKNAINAPTPRVTKKEIWRKMIQKT